MSTLSGNIAGGGVAKIPDIQGLWIVRMFGARVARTPSPRSRRRRTVVLGKVSFGVFLFAQSFLTLRVLARALEQSDVEAIRERMHAVSLHLHQR